MKSGFKNDTFKKARGGYSRLLEISCESCGEFVCNYQKDGPGILKRMYLDRILQSGVESYSTHKTLKEIPQLACKNCSLILGVPMMYKKENRLAYRLYVGAITKKIVKS